MPDIAFMTYIHNGEKTMRKSIESVLNQENVDLVYYLINNASTDSTWEIMCEYADRDNRVRLIQNDNSLIRLPEYIKNIKDCEYFAVLDADDWYEPAFAKEAIAFAKKEDLDIVAVGICESTPDGKKDYRQVEKSVVVTCQEFTENLKLFTRFFTAMWGKVYKLTIVQTMDFSKFRHISLKGVFFAADTVFSLSAVQRSGKIGVLNQVLHQWRVLDGSDSRRYRSDHLIHTEMLIEMWLEIFVNIEKMEKVHFENYICLVKLSLKFLQSIIVILMKSEMDSEGFLKEIERIIKSPVTKMCMEMHPDLKEEILAVLVHQIHKTRSIEKNSKLGQMLYECLKKLDGEDLFKALVK